MILLKLDESMRSHVCMEDNKKVQVHGKGVVTVDILFGKKTLHDTMYLPSLAQNLTSLGQLIKKGFYAIFNEGRCMIYDKGNQKLSLFVTMIENEMFPLEFSDLNLSVFSVSS